MTHDINRALTFKLSLIIYEIFLLRDDIILSAQASHGTIHSISRTRYFTMKPPCLSIMPTQATMVSRRRGDGVGHHDIYYQRPESPTDK